MLKIKKHSFFKMMMIFWTCSFAGCSVGPDFEPPDMEIPAHYRFTGFEDASPGDPAWWELFSDPVLGSLVKTALENNRDVQIAASRIEEARAQLGYVRSFQYPQINIDAGAGAGNFSSGRRSDSTNKTAYIAPALGWEIDFWGKYRRGTESARASLSATEHGLRALQLSLIADVASTYYILLDFNGRLAIARETLKTRLKTLDIIQQRYDQGVVPELDLNQAQIQKENAAVAIPNYERLIAKTENALSILLGRMPQGIEKIGDLDQQTVPLGIPTGLPSELLERRPDICQAMYLLQAQNAKIGATQALRFPSISLTGAFGLASTELASATSEGGVWSVFGGLFGPIYHFNKYKRQVDVERERTRQALLAYERAVLNAFREVEDALVEIDTYRRQLLSSEVKLKAATNAEELALIRYDKGVSSYLEVLDANRTSFSVALEASQLKQLYLNAYINLYKAMGGGWISKAEMAAQRDSKQRQ